VAPATVLYQDLDSTAEHAEAEGDALWITLPELTATTGWQLKPEGVCKDEICVPVPDARRASVLRERPSGALLNLTEFARLIEQPVAHDAQSSAWYFGPPGWEWRARLGSRQAPDFTLPDLSGQMHSLSELRGVRVFLLFWASW
jgi:hypothetical protein